MIAAVKLRRHTGRLRAGRFLAEGPNLVEAAAARGLVDEVFATVSGAERHLGGPDGGRFADGLLGGVPVHLVTDSAARDLSETVTPAGIVAVCRFPDADLASVLEAGPRLAAVMVDVSEPGNAGSVIRTADAMGADAVLLAGHSVDPYNGKCLRSSAGSIFGLPVFSEPDVPGLIARLRGAGLQLLATTVDGELSLDEAGPLLGEPTAWIFGPEARGLPAELARDADHRVAIPVAGSAESLNVAAAAAICLYQSARARRHRLG